MRITQTQQQKLKQNVNEIADTDATVLLFRSRVDDTKQGGGVDLLVKISREIENPAVISARSSAVVSKLMSGHHADVLHSVPNLKKLVYLSTCKVNKHTSLILDKNARYLIARYLRR